MNLCPVCQNSSPVCHIRKSGNYDILYCQSCRLQFSDPMLEPGASFYQKSHLYEERSKDYRIKLHIPGYEWRYKTCLKLCAIRPNQSLLDIGCGDGGFLALAQEKGFNVFGIDIDERAIELGKNVRKLQNVESGSWKKIEGIAGWKDFDVITVFEMLEHVSSPLSLVTTIFELLKPDGLMCITVPRLDRYPKVFDKEADSPPHHFTLWTSRALEILLRKTGFEEIQIIEKPLLVEDLFLRQIRGIKSVIRRLWGREKEGKAVYVIIRGGLVLKVIKKSLLAVLKTANWLLAAFRLGRGHTLLAMAKKPQ